MFSQFMLEFIDNHERATTLLELAPYVFCAFGGRGPRGMVDPLIIEYQGCKL